MKASLHFSLPEDQGDFDAALLGRNAISSLWEIDQHLRGLLKHGDPSDEVRNLCQAIRDMIPDACLEV